MTDTNTTETVETPSAFEQFKAAAAAQAAAKEKLSEEANVLEIRLRAIRKIVPKTRAPRAAKPEGEKPKPAAKGKK